MKTNTRYVLLGGAAILVVGLISGGVAYWQGGFPGLARAQAGPDALRYVPADASLVAYANVRDVMASSFRDHLQALELGLDGQQEFRDQTGINISEDIDTVVAGLIPDGEDSAGLVLLTGRFDTQRLAELVERSGGRMQEYGDRRLWTRAVEDRELAMSFLEPGVLGLGSPVMVRRAIDLSVDQSAPDVTSNERLMGLMTYVRSSDNAWAVGRFEGGDTMPYLPEEVMARIPPVAGLAVGGRVNGGVSATLTLEARDEQAGQDLHAIAQGFVALARLQTESLPNLAGLLDSLQLVQTGNAVTLAFHLPPEILQLAEPPAQDRPQ